MKKTILVTLLLLVMISLYAQIKEVNFTEQYKKDNNGKYKIEINEVKELIHIMLAITKYGFSNDDMFQQNGKYYQDLVAHFKPYENDKIIITFDSLLRQSPLNYIFLTGNAITYNFENEKLVSDKIFLFPGNEIAGVKITINPITTYKKELEDFSQKSGFRLLQVLRYGSPSSEEPQTRYCMQVHLDRSKRPLSMHYDAKPTNAPPRPPITL